MGYIKPPLSFFKDSKGAWRTQSLFIENEHPPHKSLWTLGEEDLVVEETTYYSLRNIYLSYPHVPGCEYDFVKEVIGTFALWKKLNASNHIGNHIRDWQAELEFKIRTGAVKKIISHSLENTTAAKYLADRGWVGTQRGRPSKAEKERLTKEDNRISNDIKDDLNRIRSIK